MNTANPFIRRAIVAAASVASFAICLPVVAQPKEGEIVQVTLISGDVLTGVLVSRVGGGVVLDHPTLGQLTLPQANVKDIQPLAKDENVEAEAEAESEAPPASEAEEVLEPGGPPPWEIRLEFGANGSSGNTDKNSVRFSTLATRDTDEGKTDLSIIYRYADENDSKTENNFFGRARHAWKFKGAPRWSVYAEGTYESDDFQDWTDRLTVFGGVGYEIIKKDDEKLNGRIGLGGTQRWGSADDTWDTQIQVAADYWKKINDRVAFAASIEYLPEIDDLMDARLRGTADLEVKLNEEGNWLMKLGVEDRYDASPGDADHNDFYYGASIVMVF